MPKEFSNLVKKIKPSFTLQMTARAAELRAKGEDVINFGVGEPDFNTPDHIIEAGKQAMIDGYTKYTPGSGMLELKEAIQTKLHNLTGINYKPENIIVSNGGKQSLSVVCQALFDSGDKVLIFSPYWVSFPEFVRIAGAEPLLINTIPDKQFEPDFDDLLLKIDDSVKGVIINSPSNPTGGVWSDEAISKLLKLSKENDWIVISDETYEELVYDNEFKAIETLDKYDCEIITIRSMSKTYAMTGWRIGYAAGPKNIIKAIGKIQSQSTSNPSSISQAAAVEALNGKQDFIKKRSNAFKQRRDFVVKSLNNIKGISCLKPNGAFYVFPSCKGLLNKKTKLKTDTDFVQKLLEKSNVAVVQGSAFGLDGYFRISYATSMKNLKKAMDRIKSFCESLE